MQHKIIQLSHQEQITIQHIDTAMSNIINAATELLDYINKKQPDENQELKKRLIAFLKPE